MGYLTERARKILADQILDHQEATRHSRVADWSSYRYTVGILDGIEIALKALAEAERDAGFDDRSFG